MKEPYRKGESDAGRCRRTTRTSGADIIEHAAEQYTLLGTGRAVTTQDLGSIALTAKSGTPVLLRDVAHVRIGAAPPEGGFTTCRLSIELTPSSLGNRTCKLPRKLA
jgi:hypothetical protein